MGFLLGFAIALIALYASVLHLGQETKTYYDFVAAAMVAGGTLAVAVITLPWAYGREIFRLTARLLFSFRASRSQLLRYCLGVIQSVQQRDFPKVAGSSLDYKILREGVELLELGFATAKIEAILKERVYYATERTKKIANAVKGLAKYPPAFGLAGTVLGLVHLMRGVSEGVNPAETGIRMAIALVATFYGLLVANLIVNPAGEGIDKIGKEEAARAEIALQAVLLAADRVNLLESQELLNSYVEDRDRVDVIGLGSGEGSSLGSGVAAGQAA